MIESFSVDDYVFAIDGYDHPDYGPRMRVVTAIVPGGYVCRTVESDLGILFRHEQLRPATKEEISKWRHSNMAFELKD